MKLKNLIKVLLKKDKLAKVLIDGNSKIIYHDDDYIKVFDKLNYKNLRIPNKSLNIKLYGNDNILEIYKNINFGSNTNIMIRGYNNKCTISQNVKFVDNNLIRMDYGDNNTICIGEGTSFTAFNGIWTENNSHIQIGKDCMIASSVRIMATDFHTISDMNGNVVNNQKNNLIIGDHVWIGENTYILKNAQIPNNVVIALGSIVTKQLKKVMRHMLVISVLQLKILIGIEQHKKYI